MVLRKHPLFNYRGVLSWPPVWTFTGGLKNKQPRREEIGILTEVTISNVQPADRCFLRIEHEGSMYIGVYWLPPDRRPGLLRSNSDAATGTLQSSYRGNR
jgi:hypothetical protein